MSNNRMFDTAVCSKCGKQIVVDRPYKKFSSAPRYCSNCRELEDREIEANQKQSMREIKRTEQRGEIEGKKCKCGHFCASGAEDLCCRCQTPANGHLFKLWSMICPICKGVLRKYPDGIRTQRCPKCGKVVVTYRGSSPVLAPMSSCGCDNPKRPRKHQISDEKEDVVRCYVCNAVCRKEVCITRGGQRSIEYKCDMHGIIKAEFPK